MDGRNIKASLPNQLLVIPRSHPDLPASNSLLKAHFDHKQGKLRWHDLAQNQGLQAIHTICKDNGHQIEYQCKTHKN
jgi:hypothetical protein